MAPPDRSASLTREQAVREGSRIWRSFLAAPLPIKILQVAGAIFALLVLATLEELLQHELVLREPTGDDDV